MKVRTPWMVLPLGAVMALVGVLAWWIFWPRPSLQGVAERIASGHYRAAEGQLREYLQVFPLDEQAHLLLARVLVERSEREPELALKLLGGLHPTDTHQAAQIRAIEGEAQFWAKRFDRAELAWLEALRLEPTIAEVGWKLLNIYAIQGRDDDTIRLGLRLFATEPDPRDRVQLLIQTLRHDAHPNEAGSIIHELEPVVRANPADLRSTVALGSAMIRAGRQETGLGLLRRAVASHRDDAEAWLAILEGSIATGAVEVVARTLDQMPRSLAESARFDAARGWLAAQNRDLDEATRAYRRALEARPFDASIAYRLKGVLRLGAKSSELAELSPQLDAIARFPDRARELFDRLNDLPDLGLQSHPELFSEIATALDQVGRKNEAAAWTSLNPGSRRALP